MSKKKLAMNKVTQLPGTPLKVMALTAIIALALALALISCKNDDGGDPSHTTHDSGRWVTTLAATCTATGTKELQCTVCGAVLNTDTIAALGHDWGNWTQTAEGVETKNCTHDSTHTAARITTATALETWLTAQNANTAAAAYTIVLNVSDLGINTDSTSDVGNVFITNKTKYVNLDLSGSTITTIDDWAFGNCSSLTSINIPNSVTTIGYAAFYNCTSLTNVILPNSVTAIGNAAFGNCSSLTSINIPNSVTDVNNQTFYNCTSLASINIPNSVTIIGKQMFYNCTSLVSIEISAGVTFVDEWAFGNWTSAQTIYVRGHASQSAADTVWDDNWRQNRSDSEPLTWTDIDAVIKYWNGTTWE